MGEVGRSVLASSDFQLINTHTNPLQVAVIDWLRQYDIIKKMERMGKSVGMIAGQVRGSWLRVWEWEGEPARVELINL